MGEEEEEGGFLSTAVDVALRMDFEAALAEGWPEIERPSVPKMLKAFLRR
jgi:hypothetical protein